jgi:uracil DNA glycosylase superfamily protein
MATFKFDKGPTATWAQKFFDAPRQHYLTHPSGRFRTEFGPVYYRGRLNGSVKVLIVGQDPSTDEILAQRNLVGSAGQRAQRLLNKMGLTKSYVMFNTFLYGIKGQMDAVMRAAAVEPTILDYRNGLFDKTAAANTLQAIISFGNGADLAITNWAARPAGVPWFQLAHPSAPDEVVLPNWNANLNAIHAAVTPDKASLVDTTPYGATFGAADSADIPREDLSFGLADWHGTGGSTRSQRDGDNTIKWTSPL